jgi:hypothetical protein
MNLGELIIGGLPSVNPSEAEMTSGGQTQNPTVEEQFSVSLATR